jgi:oligo-1,6-glucosidase/alpha-glucosidase
MTNADWESMEHLCDVDAINHAEELIETGPHDSFEDVRDVVGYRSRDNARTPMQWNDGEHAGFTDDEPWIRVNQNYEDVNVAAAEGDDSITQYYRDLIDLRAEYDALVYGAYRDLLPDHERLCGYTQTLADTEGTVEERLLTVLNFTGETTSVDLPVSVDDPTLLLSNYDRLDPAPSTAHEPYEARIYRLL